MKRWIIGVSAVGALAVAAGAYAQDRGGAFRDGPWMRSMRPQMSADDMAAFTDARIAALHAGLKLGADQEKLWPPVEDAIRGLAKQRHESREAGRERFTSMRQTGAGPDIPGALRFMADRQTASGEALRKLADAMQPLYGSLDEAQKRRLMALARPFRRDLGMGMGMDGPGRPGGPGGPGQRPWQQRGDLGAEGRDFAFEAAPPPPGPRR